MPKEVTKGRQYGRNQSKKGLAERKEEEWRKEEKLKYGQECQNKR